MSNKDNPSPSPHVTALGLLEEAIQSVEESMAADAPDGETVDPAHYDVVIPYEDAKQILVGLTPPPQTRAKGRANEQTKETK